MICVDTSIWVESLRRRESLEARTLSALLDEDSVALPILVRVELLSGAGREDRIRLRRVLSALPVWMPSATTWVRIDSWIDVAADAGERFGIADLLIAAIAVDHDATVWSNDSDFQRMSTLGFVKLNEPE